MKHAYLIILLVVVSYTGFTQQSVPSASFNSIEAFGPFEIELIKSDNDRVEMDYRGIDKEDVIYEVQRGVVKLKLKSRHYFDEWSNNDFKKSEYVQVKVFYTDMDVIKARAGAVVTSRELVKSKYLRLESSMGAEVKLEILAKDIETKTTMGGILELTGQVERMDANAAMGGVLRASHLESKVAIVKATMGADVDVNAKDELEVSSAFGASVDYIGGPAVRHTNSTMGGEINRKGN